MQSFRKNIYRLCLALFALTLFAGPGCKAVWATAGTETAAAGTVKTGKITVTSAKVKASQTGSVYGKITVKYKAPNMSNLKLRIRVLNSEGKYVYQKTYKNLTASTTKITRTFKWNGKASAGNSAGLTKGVHVANGSYKVQIRLSGFNGKKTVSVTRKRSLKVAREEEDDTTSVVLASVTTKGSMLTGDAELDYMVELALNAAGVTSSMTEDEKVQKIYYFISHNWKHIEGLTFAKLSKYAAKFSLSSANVAAYKKTADALIASGKAKKVSFKFSNGASVATVKQYFKRRVGQCTQVADAFVLMCSHVGVTSGICTGYYLNSDGSKSGHNWNWAKIGKTYYYYDVDVQLKNLARKAITNNYFPWWYKATKSVALAHHKFTSGLK